MQVSKTLLEDILRRYGCGEGQVNDLAKEAGMLRADFLNLAQDRGIPTREQQRAGRRAAARAERETAAEQANADAAANPEPVQVSKAVKTKSAKSKRKRKLKPKAKPLELVQPNGAAAHGYPMGLAFTDKFPGTDPNAVVYAHRFPSEGFQTIEFEYADANLRAKKQIGRAHV